MNNVRLENILNRLESTKVDQMIISDPSTIFYITGEDIHPGERMLALYISQNKKPVLVVNKLFFVEENENFDIVYYSDTDDAVSVLCKYTDGTKPIGVDKLWPAKFLLSLLDLGGATKCINTSIAPDSARMTKDSSQQELMRVASKINDTCMAEFKKLVREGVTELEIAKQIPEIFKAHGADGLSFSPIVAFGANASDGHHRPNNTVLKKGDCVLFDVGCIKDGYCSDMTRTFFYDHVSEEHAKIYNIVRLANETAEEMIKPGVLCSEIDKSARDVIKNEGYGEFFVHRLGHSIGFECHEAGDISAVNHQPVEPGMIFSVEPGIYLRENMGVRIEDLVMVTKDGVERLNNFPKELTIIK